MYMYISRIDSSSLVCSAFFAYLFASFHFLVSRSAGSIIIPSHPFNLSSKMSRKIPKFLFRMAEWEWDELPPVFRTMFKKCVTENPDYTLYYFGRNQSSDFVSSFYPQFLNDYRSVKVGAFRADIFRLLVLYSFGGIYNDIGQTFVRNISDVVNSADEFVSVKEINNWGIYQSFIAAYPRHPLIKAMIDYVMDMVHRKDYSDCSICITGPYAVFNAFNYFFNRKRGEPISGGLYKMNNYQLKFYYHIPPHNDRISHDNEVGFITSRDHDSSAAVIRTKFLGYKAILYTNSKRKYYTEQWSDRDVFLNETKVIDTSKGHAR